MIFLPMGGRLLIRIVYMVQNIVFSNTVVSHVMFSPQLLSPSNRLTKCMKHRFNVLVLIGFLGFEMGLAVAQTANIADPGAASPLVSALPPIVHLVEQGDTLWMISERYYGQALSWPQIRHDNRVEEPRRLQPGTLLLLRAGLLDATNSAMVFAVTGDVRLMTPVAQSVANRTLTQSKTNNTSGSPKNTSAPVLTIGPSVEKGMNLATGSIIKTGPDSFVTLLLPNQSRATLPSNSQIKLAGLKDAKGQTAILLDLNVGQVDARVQAVEDAGARTNYRIRTRLATIGARGTYFRVVLQDAADAHTTPTSNPNASSPNSTSTSASNTLVGVLEGTVAANWAGLPANTRGKDDALAFGQPSAALLKEGQGSVLVRGTAPQKAALQQLLPAPALQEADSAQNQEDVLVRWLPVLGAAAYRVQVARDAEFNDLIAQQDMTAQADLQNVGQAAAAETDNSKDKEQKSQESKESYKAWFSKLTKGSYFVRVSAFAANGLEGLFALAGFSRLSYEVSGTVVLAVDSNQLEFSWTPLPSSSYTLEIATDKEFTQLVLSTPNILGDKVQIAALPPGQYFWRVQAQVQAHGQTTTVLSKTMPMLLGGVR